MIALYDANIWIEHDLNMRKIRILHIKRNFVRIFLCEVTVRFDAFLNQKKGLLISF